MIELINIRLLKILQISSVKYLFYVVVIRLIGLCVHGTNFTKLDTNFNTSKLSTIKLTSTLHNNTQNLSQHKHLSNYLSNKLYSNSLQQQYRVVNGEKSKMDEYEFYCTFSNIGKTGKPSQKCGCSLIDSRQVLSAAHCIKDTDNTQNTLIQFLVSDNLNSQAKEDVIAVKPCKFIIHPIFKAGGTREQDLVLILLEKNIYRIKPIALASPEYAQSGKQAKVIGHGKTEFEGKGSRHLLEAELKLYDCRNFGLTQLCASDQSDKDNIKDACSGDSGGPLFVPKKRMLLGVVSQGFECATVNKHGVYVNMSYSLVVDWIKKYIPNVKINISYDEIKFQKFKESEKIDSTCLNLKNVSNVCLANDELNKCDNFIKPFQTIAIALMIYSVLYIAVIFLVSYKFYNTKDSSKIGKSEDQSIEIFEVDIEVEKIENKNQILRNFESLDKYDVLPSDSNEVSRISQNILIV